MGQYQQWLHYRDIDRLLHAQLEELEEELAQLHSREQLLQQMLQPATEGATSLLQPDNEILHALAIGLNGHAEPLEHTQEQTPPTSSTTEMTYNGTAGTTLASPRPDPLINGGTAFPYSSLSDESMAAISSASATRNGLPPAEEQHITNPVAVPNSFQPSQPLLNRNMALPPIPHSPRSPHNPHYESMLLPEDMDAFIDGHSETEPRMELPDWLRNATLQNANGPIDQESMRTNRLIQRWIERWGRHQEPQGHQGPPSDAQELHGEDMSL